MVANKSKSLDVKDSLSDKEEVNSASQNAFAFLLKLPQGKRYQGNFDNLRKQSSQKGPTCWYYMFNYLRPRYGSAFPIDYKPRRIELLFSQYRKKLTLFDVRFNSEIRKLELNPRMLDDPEFLRLNFQDNVLYQDYTRNKLQNENFKTYLKRQFYVHEIKASYALIKEFNKNYRETEGYEHFDLKRLETLHLSLHLETIKVAVSAYKLDYSIWTPTFGFDTLMMALKAKGPMGVIGKIGKAYYSGLPKKASFTLEGENIYYFTKDQAIDQLDGHAVVLVGGMRNSDGGKYVFYTDPNDGRAGGQELCVYMVSYDNFVKRLQSYDGVHYLVESQPKANQPFVEPPARPGIG